MPAPLFSNMTRRWILAVAEGGPSPSILRNKDQLHQAVLNLDWEALDAERLLEFADHPQIARGTLLRLYWRHWASNFAHYTTSDAAPEPEGDDYDASLGMENVLMERTDLQEGIAYDPRNDEGRDLTKSVGNRPQRRVIPAELYLPVPGEIRTQLVWFDILDREPSESERAAIAAKIAEARGLLPKLVATASPRDVVVAIAGAMQRLPPSQADLLAWLWLDQVGLPWQCCDSASDGVLFGVSGRNYMLFVPDIVQVTLRRRVNPMRTVAFFDLLRRQPPEKVSDEFWYEVTKFPRMWICSRW